MRARTSMLTLTRMEESYFAESVQEQLKTVATQILMSTSRATAVVRMLNFQATEGWRTVTRRQRWKFRSASETLKLNPTLSSISLKYLVVPTNAIDMERFTHYMEKFCHSHNIFEVERAPSTTWYSLTTATHNIDQETFGDRKIYLFYVCSVLPRNFADFLIFTSGI